MKISFAFSAAALAAMALGVSPAFSEGPPQVFWEAPAQAYDVTFSPDGSTMYTGGLVLQYPYSYGNIRQWDVPSLSVVYTLTHAGAARFGFTNDVAVSPDGASFASAHGSLYCLPDGGCYNIAPGLNLWSTAGDLVQGTGPGEIDGIVRETAYSPDGRFVAIGLTRTNEDEIRVYSLPGLELHASYAGHGTGTFCVSFSPTANILATGGWDGMVRLWDVEANQLLRTLTHGTYTDGGYPVSLAFSPDGSMLACAGNGYNVAASVWDVASGNLIHRVTVDDGDYGAAATIAVSPNARYLAAGIARYVSGHGWQGAIRFWDLQSGALAREYVETSASGNNAVVTSLAFSPLADDWYAYTYNETVRFARTDLNFGSRAAGAPDESTLRPASGFVQAYPNPFSTSTTLRYQVPRFSTVTLSVHDAMGRRVSNLVDGEMREGVHEVSFNAAGLAAGTYFCRLRIGNTVESERIVVTRRR